MVASVDSLLPQHSSIGGVGKGHSITGKDVDATHYASSEFKVEGLPDSPELSSRLIGRVMLNYLLRVDTIT